MDRQAQIERVLKDCPPKSAGVLEKAYAGTASPRSAIKAKCLECLSYDRKAIADCTGFTCPVWVYRPFQKKAV